MSVPLYLALSLTALAQEAPPSEDAPVPAEEAAAEGEGEGEPPAEEPPAEEAPAEEPTVEATPNERAPTAAAAAVDIESPPMPEPVAEPETGPAEKKADRPANAWERKGFGWGGLPFANYNSDSGFGFGVVGSVYRYDGNTAPYKWAMNFLVYLNTTGGHTYRVDLDMLNVANAPLRISSRLEFNVSRNDWYCELGTANSCDAPDAEAALAAQGLVDDPDVDDDEYDTALNNYYKLRYMNPNGFINARYRLRDKPHRVELMFGWWGQYLLSGDLSESGPYGYSLYEDDYPNGEEGFSSNLQAGIMFDNRDNEPAPTHGYWAEASIRGASKYWGSAWSYFGYNLTMRFYLSHPGYRDLVLATRLVHDGIIGDPNVIEMSRAGGSVIYDFFGGQRAGRGVRFAGVNGRVRFLAQPEVRWTAIHFKLAKVPIDVGFVGFTDLGFWAEDWSTIGSEPRNPVVGVGGGLRLTFDQNFIIRADLGFSEREQWSPGIYLDLGNLW